MKKKMLLFTLSAGLAAVVFNSSSSGPAHNNNTNATGGPGSAGTCNSCHSGGSGTVTGTSIALRKKSDNSPANGKYTPDETYVVTVKGTHTSLSKFGFQLIALKDGANTQAGSFSNFGGDKHSTTLGGRAIVEHHHTLSKTGAEYVAEFDWKAPSAGTGNVKFHGIINAVDGTGTTGGDVTSAPFNQTFAESTNGINDAKIATLHVYPNPAKEVLNISLKEAGTYTIRTYSLDGKITINKNITLQAANEVSMPLLDMATGTYILEVSNGNTKQTMPFVKQ